MTSIASLHDAFTKQYLAPADAKRLYLDFSGYVTELVTNSQELVDKLRDYFRDFLPPEGSDFGSGGATPTVTITALEAPAPDIAALGLTLQEKPREPGKKIKEDYVNLPGGRFVLKRLTGMVFLFGQGTNMVVGPCVENDNQVVNFVNNRFIEWTLDQDALLFHAAGVALPSPGEEGGLRGMALAGFAGMGKSTLSLHIMRHGATFVSNDRLMVRKNQGGLTMYGVAKMPRINPGTVLHNPDLASVISGEERRRFAAMPPEELWSLEHKYDAFIDECFGPGRFKLIVPMRALVLLNWKKPHEAPGQPIHIQQVDLAARPDLMPAFMKDVGLFYGTTSREETPDFSADAYRALLRECPVFELTGTADFEAAAKACLELV